MYLYGVFAPSLVRPNSWRWGMTYNKRVAIKAAKGVKGSEVRRMTDCPEVSAWDCPTFRVCSDLIFSNP